MVNLQDRNQKMDSQERRIEILEAHNRRLQEQLDYLLKVYANIVTKKEHNYLQSRVAHIENWLKEECLFNASSSGENKRRRSGSRSRIGRERSGSRSDAENDQDSRDENDSPSSILGLSATADTCRSRNRTYSQDPSFHSSEEESLAAESQSRHRDRDWTAPKTTSDKVEKWLDNTRHRRDAKQGVKRSRANSGGGAGGKTGRRKAPAKYDSEDSGDEKIGAGKCEADRGVSAPLYFHAQGRCRFGCHKVSRKVCEVCNKHVCADHRFTTILCPDYWPVVKDCYDQKADRPVPKFPLFKNSKDKNGKPQIGRCVGCSGGKHRTTSRTQCQTCGRYICAKHQLKHIRCPQHREVRTAAAADERERSPSSYRPRNIGSEVIDHLI